MKWIVLAFLCMLNLEALYMGNPALPGAVIQGIYSSEEALIGFKAGYQADVVFDRKLKSYGGARARMDQFHSLWNQGVVTCSIADRVDLYGSVGAMQATFSHRPPSGGSRREYQTSDKTTWGGGARVIVYEWKACSIGVEGSYQWAKPPLKWDSLNGTSFTTSAHLHYQEWQVGIGISRQIEMFLPYAAFKYSSVKAKVTPLRSDLDLTSRSFHMTNRDHFGLAFGCTFTTSKYFDLTLESRCLDELALSLAGNLRF